MGPPVQFGRRIFTTKRCFGLHASRNAQNSFVEAFSRLLDLSENTARLFGTRFDTSNNDDVSRLFRSCLFMIACLFHHDCFVCLFMIVGLFTHDCFAIFCLFIRDCLFVYTCLSFVCSMVVTDSGGKGMVICKSLEVLRVILDVPKSQWKDFCASCQTLDSYQYDRFAEVEPLDFSGALTTAIHVINEIGLVDVEMLCRKLESKQEDNDMLPLWLCVDARKK